MFDEAARDASRRRFMPCVVLAFQAFICDAFGARENHYRNGVIMPETAQKGDTVSVHYTGRLEDGETFDSSEEGEPLEFEVGAGDVIPGFDEAVLGMSVGDKKTIEIEPDDAYGQRIDTLVQSVARSSMNLDAEPQIGMNLIMQLPDNNQIPVAITDVTADQVTLDANHPLAGHKLTFDVELVNIKKQ